MNGHAAIEGGGGTADVADRRGLHRRALVLAWLTVTWNVVEAVIAVGTGWWTGSTALITFGADSGIEVIAAVGLVWRLHRAGPEALDSEEQQAERTALYVVAATFVLLGVYVAVESASSLVSGERPESTMVGLVLAAISLIVMPVLAFAKQRTGRRLGSRAIVAESVETWVCSYLSLALLVGVGLNWWLGAWWADAVAALAMLPVVAWQAWETFEDARN